MNKTKPQPVNATQVKQFLADARRRVVAAKRNLAIDAETGYQVAYEAMIKGSLALMLSHGQRPRKQLGHHMVIIDFAKDNLMRAPAETFALFDRMRRKRNQAFYGIAVISDTEAQEAVATAESFLRLLADDIKTRLL
jgi:uncharacterized protein (UPF0332 family)